MSYSGISKKIMNDGSINILVRFKYQNISYNNKNFTKLFGCKTEKQAYDKLQEIKVEISKGNNPFIETKETLNDLWDERYERKVRHGEWNEITARGYKYFYNAHIRELIGWKKISKIDYNDLEKVSDKLAYRQGGSKNQFKRMMNSLFDDCIKKGLLTKNIILDLKTHQEGKAKNIEQISNEDFLSIVRKMYAGIPDFTIQNNCGIKTEEEIREYRMFLYMVLLTAHRYGEILKLKKEYVILGENKIISPSTITKTKEDYHFPIPMECRDYIESIESGLLFPTINKSAIWHVYQRYIRDCGINIYEGKKLSIHDTRRLMLSIMIMDCGIDSRLADSCLNHKQKGVIKHYLHFQYKDIEGAYQKYWKKIRNEEDDVEDDEITLDDIPKEMLEMLRQLKKMKKSEATAAQS